MKEINKKTEPMVVMGDYTLKIKGDLGEKTCFLSRPGMKTLKKVFPMIRPFRDEDIPDVLGAGEILLRECFVGGDREFLTESQYIIGGSIQAMALVEFAEGELKKN